MDGVTDEGVAALRAHLDPDDRAADPILLDVGFSNVVVRFDGSVARIARNRHAGEGHRREAAVLPAIARHLPVAVPSPVRLVPPGPAMPYGAAIHPLLAGSVMTQDDAARSTSVPGEIASTLASLHALDATTFAAGLVPVFDPTAEVRRQERSVGPWLRDRLTSRRWRRLQSSWHLCDRFAPARERVLCHGDAWYGNMLIDNGALSGLLDWQSVCVADPVLDLAPQRYLGAGASARVIEPYLEMRRTRIPDLLDRIECFMLLREVGGLAYVLGQRMEDEYDDALEKVGRLLD